MWSRGLRASLRALVRLSCAPVAYAKLAWWGLAAPRVVERAPLIVVQAIVHSERGEILLAVRSDLQGWELPGGTPKGGEPLEDALRREVEEESGLQVIVERVVGDYVRTGFRPHTARVYQCRVSGGRLRSSHETLALRWFDPSALPDTLFPWYRDADHGCARSAERSGDATRAPGARRDPGRAHDRFKDPGAGDSRTAGHHAMANSRD